MTVVDHKTTEPAGCGSVTLGEATFPVAEIEPSLSARSRSVSSIHDRGCVLTCTNSARSEGLEPPTF